uniref:CHK domain-containing protein n=1 Tax=Glossina brevipalpis TaxID=37001 RepID=A0A1A9W8G1_9MUSC
MTTPEWLTEQYLQKVLSIYHDKQDLKILKFNINPALAKGENYGGNLNKVNIHYRLNNRKEVIVQNLMVKTSYENDEFIIEKLKPYDIFNREISIYEKVLPKLKLLLNEINDSEEIFIKVIFWDYKQQILIFEDVSMKGYTMPNRVERLDKDHVKLVLKKLAKLHASSAVLNERENKCLEIYDRGFFNRYTDTYKTYFVSNLMACARYLDQSPKYAKYAEKLFALKSHYMNIGVKCFEPCENDVNVLAHGDVWTNNLMFRYDQVTKKPNDVLIIDFQYAFWGSPTLDLHYFFNTSLKETLRLNELDELFQNYHKFFVQTLLKLNYSMKPIPSLRKFFLEMEQKRFFAFHSAVVIQPVMINEDSKDVDFKLIWGEDESAINFKNNLYKNPQVQDILKNLLPIFYSKGLLESLCTKSSVIKELR